MARSARQMKLSYDLPDSKKVGSWSVTNPFDYFPNKSGPIGNGATIMSVAARPFST
jgi:hypothetical protein